MFGFSRDELAKRLSKIEDVTVSQSLSKMPDPTTRESGKELFPDKNATDAAYVRCFHRRAIVKEQS